MADTPTPRKHRWWLVPLTLAVLVGLIIVLRPAITQWSWARTPDYFYAYDIDASSENNIVLAGAGILRYNGLWWQHITYPWREEDVRGDESVFYNYSVRARDIEVWNRTHIYAACGPKGILHYNGLWWSFMTMPRGYDPYYTQVWAQSARSIYAIDRELGLLHAKGRTWDRVSLPDDFDPSYVGGNDECLVVLGETQEDLPDILVESDGVWSLADIQPFLASVEPRLDCLDDDSCRYSLYPDEIWALPDGRIIVRIRERFDLAVIAFHYCPFLLCYQEGNWSTIDPPNDEWYPEHVMADDEGYLLVYGEQGDRYRQVTSEDGKGWAWQQIDGEWPGRILGYSTFLDTSDLLVYGGEPYIPTGVMDVSYFLTTPFTLERYELAW